MKTVLYSYVLILLCSIPTNAQSIENIRTTSGNEKIFITYDLVGDPRTAIDIHVRIKLNDSKEINPSSVVGDLKGVLPGRNKRIEWDALKEIGDFDGKVLVQLTIKSSLHNVIEDLERSMIFIQGGTFTMGSGGYRDPYHSVTLSSYKIGKYEITQAQWLAVMGFNPAGKKCMECPVIGVSWNDAVDFLKKLNKLTGKNYRLPTEAEWEYAAKGGAESKDYEYSGSNKHEEVAWLVFSKGELMPVGQKKPNELGLYDMSGNAREWCLDWFDTYPIKHQVNPEGPISGEYRVYRGGGRYDGKDAARVNSRDYGAPEDRSTLNGLRVVLAN